MALAGSLMLRVFRAEDVLWARQEAKRFAAGSPFGADDLQRIELAASELASNMVKHARGGKLRIERLERGGRHGVRMVAEDQGPGIPDLEQALAPGYSTAGSLGDGLSALQDLMDKFEISSRPGFGPRVEVEKWAP